jgi:hypothetical protein
MPRSPIGIRIQASNRMTVASENQDQAAVKREIIR